MESEGEEVIKVTVKFNGRSIPISLSPDSTIRDLKSLLQPLTNVLLRGQKLISKGKMLVDDMTLRQSEISNGAKVMLMASLGLHQGDGPILKKAESRPISRVSDASSNSSRLVSEKIDVPVSKDRVDRWKATGVVALAECNLKTIPEEVWTCESSARLLDLSNNCIQDLPSEVCRLNLLQKLLLKGNGMLDGSIQWEGLKSLKHLTLLSLSHNNLTSLPPEVGALCSLRQLHVSNNKLNGLPFEIGLLTKLEDLKANNNWISSIPASIGDCKSLVEVDLSSNYLTELPDAFGNICNLKALRLGNNGLKSLPSTLFKMCLQLATLDLHNTEITMDTLRQLEGWDDFDERRRSKHQKQLDFRVVGSAEFDEGADKN